MNVYDTVNKLATELKESEEYVNYKKAKNALDSNPDLKNKIKEFEEARYESQLEAMQTGNTNEEKVKKMQELYIELIKDEEAQKFFDAEMKFNILLADVNKIIGDSIKDVLE